MRLPYLQLEADFISGKAALLAGLLRCPRAHAIGYGVELFAFAVTETAAKDKAPDGVLLDPDAPTIIESVVGWTGEPGRLFDAMVRAGLVEHLEIGARVRGLDRYAKAWKKAEADRIRKSGGGAKDSDGIPPEVARNSDGGPPEKSGQTQTQTQNQDQVPSEPLRAAPARPKPKPDPRLKPLTDRLVAAYEQARGSKYAHSGAKDAQALKRLMPVATDEEIERRWRLGLRGSGWLSVSTLAQLAAKWNDLTGPPSTPRGMAMDTESNHPEEPREITNF